MGFHGCHDCVIGILVGIGKRLGTVNGDGAEDGLTIAAIEEHQGEFKRRLAVHPFPFCFVGAGEGSEAIDGVFPGLHGHFGSFPALSFLFRCELLFKHCHAGVLRNGGEGDVHPAAFGLKDGGVPVVFGGPAARHGVFEHGVLHGVVFIFR